MFFQEFHCHPSPEALELVQYSTTRMLDSMRIKRDRIRSRNQIFE